MSHPKYPHIFEPIKIGNVVFKNRIWSAPAGVHLLYGREESPSDAAVKYYAAKAAGRLCRHHLLRAKHGPGDAL